MNLGDIDELADAIVEDDIVIESNDAPPPPTDAPPRKQGSDGWYPRLNDGGQQAIFYDSESTNIVSVGPKGCRPLDTQIYASDGLVRLGRLKPLSSMPDTMAPISFPVTSFDGKRIIEAIATGYWNEADDCAIKAELENGAELTGSPRHPVWVCWQSPNGNFGFRYCKLSVIRKLRSKGWRFWTPFIGHPAWSRTRYQTVDIMVRSETCSVCGKRAVARGLCANHYQNLAFKHGRKDSFPKLIPETIVIDEDIGYMLGALVGDGCLNCLVDHRSVAFSNVDTDCIQAVDKGVAKIGCEMWKRNFINLTITPKIRIAGLLERLDLAHLSYHKRIPDAIVESPKSVAAAFLSGLFDTDGSVCKAGNIALATVSEMLASDVQSMLSAFGILSIKRRFTTAADAAAWRISIHGRFAEMFGKLIGFKITRKQRRICQPRPSRLTPLGYGHNRYGFPDPIRMEMRRVSLLPSNPTRNRAWHKSIKRLKSFGSIPCREKLDAFCDAFGCHDRFTRFMLSNNWLELSSLKETRCSLADLSVDGTHSFLAEGAINHNSAKTYGHLHRLVRHCYEEPNALAVIIGVSQRIASEGAGYDLVTSVLPTWKHGNREPQWLRKDGKLIPNPAYGQLIDAGIGLEFTQWKLDPVTKDRHLWIANRHGGWSKVLLISIQHPQEVRKKMFGIQPSMVYIEELMNCGGDEYYSYTKAQLNRRSGIQGPQVWMASQNTESTKHWTHKLLYEDCVVSSGGRVWPNDPHMPGVRRKESWAVYYIWFEENEHNLPGGYLDTLNDAFRADPVLRERMLEAKWLDYPDGAALFRNHYNVSIHRKGRVTETRVAGLMPVPGYPIVIGSDPGQVHCGISFEQCIPIGKNLFHWTIFDELCWFGERIPWRRATRWLLEKMAYWNRRTGQTFAYRHVSGDDATTVFNPATGSVLARDIEDFSREIIAEHPDRFPNIHPIKIAGCPRPANSKEQRASLVMDLLDAQLLSVSASCPWHTEMFRLLVAAKDNPMEPARGKYIHTFDGMTYPIFFQQYVLKRRAFSGATQGGSVTVATK